MAAQPHVYVIQGRAQQDYSDCQAALAGVPAGTGKITALARQVQGGTGGVGGRGPRTGAIPGEPVGIVGLGNTGSAFARRVAAFETKVIACDPSADDRRFKELGVERVTLE